MSYHKITTISGDTAKGRKYSAQHGHWKPESLSKLAKRLKMTGNVIATFSTSDTSGRGRGSIDGIVFVVV
jgi:hypothetical protein